MLEILECVSLKVSYSNPPCATSYVGSTFKSVKPISLVQFLREKIESFKNSWFGLHQTQSSLGKI
jgi:hypothetical protein